MNSKYEKYILISLYLISLLIFSGNVFAQDEKLLSVKHMSKDFDDVLLAVEAHPDPYTHISEQDFMAKFNEVKSSIIEPLTPLEFYKKVATIIALIKDGHSTTRLPSFWMSKKRKENGVFPYEVFLTNDDELYFSKNYSVNEVPIPSKITKLNGISVDSFLNKIDPFISYETRRWRNTKIDDLFEMYLYITFGFSNNLKIEYLHADTSKLQVRNIPYNEWQGYQKDNKDEREKKIARGEPYEYHKTSDGIGMINVYSFSVATRNLDDYDRFLKKTFKSISNDSIHSLIIDIRGNYGGWPQISSRLFHYITDKPFKTMAKSNLKISKAYREYYYNAYPYLRQKEVLINKKAHYIDLDAVLRNKLGTYVDEDIIFNELPYTRKYEFKGDCYLLTNRDSYSAASSFASTFQCYQLGTIIGEETGGTKIFRANAIYTQLKRTFIWVRMSTTKKYATCYNNEMEGVLPTIVYAPSIFEIGSEMDTQLLFTQRLIKQVQKKNAEMKKGE